MKKQWIIIVLLGWIFGLNTDSTAQPALSDNAPQNVQTESVKLPPHRLQMGYGLLMYKEAYKIFTKAPIMNLTLTYAYDIPWRYERTNIFVLAGSGYSTGRREKGLYKSSNGVVFERYFYDQVHIYSGLGVDVKLPYSLSLSFSAALDASAYIEVGSYPSYYNSDATAVDGDHVSRSPWADMGIQCRTALFLSYKIKRISVSVGCQAYLGPSALFDDFKAGWRDANQPDFLWATLGVGYRF